VANSATGYISLTTNGTNWGYLSSGNNYLPNLTTGVVSATALYINGVSITAGGASFNRTNLTLGTVYGPAATDGFVIAQGRIDGVGGINMSLSVKADTNNPPQTERAFQESYNSGSGYYGTIFMTVPVKAGEYYQILCNNSTTCGGGAFVGSSSFYFVSSGGSGTSGGSSSPTSPGGNSGNIQYNGSGSFAGSHNFAWLDGTNTVSVTGTVSATNLYASSVSGTTGTFGSIGGGNLAASGYVRAATISATSAIQVGSNNLTCASGISGTMRYSAVSSTMEYCNGSAWTSMGPSATTPVAFRAYATSDQSVGTSTPSKLAMSGVTYDTNNNYSSTNSKFTPTVPGYYLVTVTVDCSSNDANTCYPAIFKNGSWIAATQGPVGSGYLGAMTSTIVYMNGVTDYLEAYAAANSGTVRGIGQQSNFFGVLLAPQGGSGGSTSPGGNTTNIQYNNGGAFSGSDNFAWVNGTSTVSVTGTVSATYGYFKYISTTNGGLGVSALASLTDVSVTGASSGMLLRYNGSKWESVGASTALSTSTMISGFPDAISCAVGGTTNIFTLVANTGTYVSYRRIRNADTSQFDLAYNISDGSLNAANSVNTTGYDCYTSSWSISQLYAQGKAFNFIGNNGTSGSGTLGDRITSGTTSIVANSNTSIISITTSGVTTGYFNSAGLLVTPGISVTTTNGISSTTGYFSGKVGIGTTNPGGALVISTTNSVGFMVTGGTMSLTPSAASADQGLQIHTDNLPNGSNAMVVFAPSGWTGNYLKANLSGTEMFAIKQDGGAWFNGNVGVGNSSQIKQGKLNVSFNAFSNQGIGLKDTGGNTAGNFIYFVNFADAIVGMISANGGSNVSYNTSSDRRLKENIVTSNAGLDKLMRIHVDDFNFIADPGKTRVQGFIAQDLYKVYPEAVTVGGPDARERPWSVDYGRVTPLLVKSVQELKVRNDNLRSQNNQLQAQLKSLKADNDNIHHELDELRAAVRRGGRS
jgi:hypothetical protein